MSNQALTEIFGRGWAFPPAFSLDEGVVMAEGALDVRQSLRILFGTEPGERIMREDYGCALYDVMFENISSDLIAGIESRIADAVLQFEPRANMTRVRAYQSDHRRSQLSIDVRYVLRGSQIEQRLTGTLNINDASVAFA
jgi:uncharacterized protein